MTTLQKEYSILKEKASDSERYSTQWNLRIKGMKEKMRENTKEEVINLLKQIAPDWASKLDDIVKTVHRVEKREEKRTRQVVVQFVIHMQEGRHSLC